MQCTAKLLIPVVDRRARTAQITLGDGERTPPRPEQHQQRCSLALGRHRVDDAPIAAASRAIPALASHREWVEDDPVPRIPPCDAALDVPLTVEVRLVLALGENTDADARDLHGRRVEHRPKHTPRFRREFVQIELANASSCLAKATRVQDGRAAMPAQIGRRGWPDTERRLRSALQIVQRDSGVGIKGGRTSSSRVVGVHFFVRYGVHTAASVAFSHPIPGYHGSRASRYRSVPRADGVLHEVALVPGARFSGSSGSSNCSHDRALAFLDLDEISTASNPQRLSHPKGTPLTQRGKADEREVLRSALMRNG